MFSIPPTLYIKNKKKNPQLPVPLCFCNILEEEAAGNLAHALQKGLEIDNPLKNNSPFSEFTIGPSATSVCLWDSITGNGYCHCLKCTLHHQYHYCAIQYI